ncbi:7TM diverse intracellular signaling domain-containing protein [Persicobacter diffluens]|uniref:Receptor n=1 Tax=Persicobacter diffluens TaxID=981 RepID=A0AAN4VZ11_9BACT|nr:hypothetical protein PEDI_32210 [Persicobacter diffluens]
MYFLLLLLLSSIKQPGFDAHYEQWISPKIGDEFQLHSFKDIPFFIEEEPLNIEDLLSKEYHWRRDSSFSKQKFQEGKTYWARIPIQLPNTGHHSFFLEFLDQSIEEFEIFLPETDAKYTHFQSGAFLPFKQRPLNHKNHAFQINPKAGIFQLIYVKIKAEHPADTHFAIKDATAFIGYSNNEYLYFGLVYGILTALLLYTLLMYIALRDKAYLFLMLYIFSIQLWFFEKDGIGFQFFWNSWPTVNLTIQPLIEYLLIMSALWFHQSFFATKKHFPKVEKYIVRFGILRTSFLVIELLSNNAIIYLRHFDVIPIGLMIYLSARATKKGYYGAPYILAAIMLIGLTLIMRSAINFGWLPLNPITFHSFPTSLILQLAVVLVAINDRVTKIRTAKRTADEALINQQQENLVLEQKVNRELENKVQERTVEIAHKNAELEKAYAAMEAQSQRIMEMNAHLDLDNYSLKKKLKKERNERIKNKHLSYEEFQEIFTDELACHRYLEEVKWQQEYKCSKCRNKKYAPGQKKFSRRCTKCGYHESITANTVFHGIRFPITKAFFLVYVGANNIKMTQEKLAESLEMRLGTVNAFLKKTKEYKGPHSNLLENL